jgi:hypothetical protein
MSEGPKRQFGLRELFWLVFLASLLAMSFLRPEGAAIAGFVISFVALLGLRRLIARVTMPEENYD